MNVNGANKTISSQKPLNVAGGTTISKGTDGFTINLSDKDNKVDIKQNPKDKTWSISIDGKTKLTLTDTEMANLKLNTNGGNDVVTVNGKKLDSSISIDTGTGQNTVSLGFDPKTRQFVDKERVKYTPNRGDTFEYHMNSPVTAGAGSTLPSTSVIKRTERQE